ncbi:MAG: hypothetical protein ACYSUU_04305 [Planctomycetota bacterium]|jgi:hypothetical protein
MRVLVAYSASSTFVGTTWEYLEGFRRNLKADVEYIHVTHDAIPQVQWPRYDAIVVSYCARLSIPGYVSNRFIEELANFRGVKAIIAQDEYENTNELLRQAERIGPDLVFTCVPPQHRGRIYSSERFPGTELCTILTGFAPDDHETVAGRIDIRAVADRPVGLGYRGRRLSPAYGRLGRLKAEVGEVMLAEAELRNVPHDISIEEKDRIYGDEWLRFIASCRCMLGSESGSNTFDWDGSIHRRCRAETDPASIRRIAEEIEAKEEDLGMGQISPRIFECAMLRTPMALIAGRYSGLLEPGIHYVPIADDFTNLDEVFRSMEDLSAMQAMADRTHTDLIASGVHSNSINIESIITAIRTTLERSQSIRGGLAHRPVGGPPHPALRLALAEKPTSVPKKRERSWVGRALVACMKRLARVTGRWR